MSFSGIIKTLAFLAILFVVLYVGMNNTERISFSFPVLAKEKILAPGALIFFGLFAVGVFAGTLLHGSGGGKNGEPKSKK